MNAPKTRSQVCFPSRDIEGRGVVGLGEMILNIKSANFWLISKKTWRSIRTVWALKPERSCLINEELFTC